LKVILENHKFQTNQSQPVIPDGSVRQVPVNLVWLIKQKFFQDILASVITAQAAPFPNG
jgi:hypothetical protein